MQVLLATEVLAFHASVAVAAFADRLKDAVDLDSVRNDLTSVVGHALEPAHLSGVGQFVLPRARARDVGWRSAAVRPAVTRSR